MKRSFRQWLFNGLAALSLVVLASAICIEVLARSANDIWTYQQSVLEPGAKKWNLWKMEFAGGGVMLVHFSGKLAHEFSRPFHEGEIHHEADIVSPIQVEAECRSPFRAVDLARFAGSFSRFGFGRGNFGLYTSHLVMFGRTQQGFAAAIPIWPIAMLAALFLIWRETKHILDRRRHRKSFGLCQNCGYDLRATPDRCPECGLLPPKKEVASL